MTIKIRGKKDRSLEEIERALSAYRVRHPQAEIEIYRQNSAAIRLRVVDAGFAKISRAKRHERIWNLLEKLPDEIQSEISLLILLTPKETAESFANFEFDHPIPSKL